MCCSSHHPQRRHPCSASVAISARNSRAWQYAPASLRGLFRTTNARDPRRQRRGSHVGHGRRLGSRLAWIMLLLLATACQKNQNGGGCWGACCRDDRADWRADRFCGEGEDDNATEEQAAPSQHADIVKAWWGGVYSHARDELSDAWQSDEKDPSPAESTRACSSWESHWYDDVKWQQGCADVGKSGCFDQRRERVATLDNKRSATRKEFPFAQAFANNTPIQQERKLGHIRKSHG